METRNLEYSESFDRSLVRCLKGFSSSRLKALTSRFGKQVGEAVVGIAWSYRVLRKVNFK